MGYSHRFFLFGDDGSLQRLPITLVEKLVIGRAKLPELANHSIRVACVALKTENGKPTEILQLLGDIWHCDARGSIQRSVARSTITALETHRGIRREGAAAGGTVIDIGDHLGRQRWQRENRWQPTPAEINRIIHAIWPETAGGAVKRPPVFKSSWKRRPPMSFEAREIMRKLRASVSDIEFSTDVESEKTLKAIIGAIREEEIADEPAENPIWAGVVASLERELDRRKAWKSRKGKWYAVAIYWRWSRGNRTDGTGDTLEYRECDGKDAAIEAGRELVRKYADYFNEDTTVEVEIHPEIEWRPSEK